MRKLLFLFGVLVMVLLLPFVSAGTLLDEEHVHGDILTINGLSYTLRVNSIRNAEAFRTYVSAVIVRQDGELVLIRGERCEMIDDIEFCVVGSETDFDTIDINGEFPLLIHLVISKYDPTTTDLGVSITKTFTPNPAVLDKTTQVDLKVSNTGNVVASFTLEDDIPAEFTIIPGQPLSLTARTVVWRSQFVRPGESANFTYNLTAKVLGNHTASEPRASISYNGTTKLARGTATSFSIINPIQQYRKITTTLSKSAIEPSEDALFSINVKENYSLSLSVEGKVTIPKFESIGRTHGTRKMGETHYINETLAPQGENTWEFFITPTTLTGINITADLHYIFREAGKMYVWDENITKELVAAVQNLTPIFYTYPENVLPGNELQVEFHLQNPNAYSPAYAIIGNITSPFFDVPINASILSAGRSERIRFIQRIPKKTRGDNFTITARGTYRFVTGELFHFSLTKTIFLNTSLPVEDVDDEPVLPPVIIELDENDTVIGELPNESNIIHENITFVDEPSVDPPKRGFDAILDAVTGFFQRLFGVK
ncbi:MAG: hypothetical protein V1725_02500 [archaeon]